MEAEEEVEVEVEAEKEAGTSTANPKPGLSYRPWYRGKVVLSPNSRHTVGLFRPALTSQIMTLYGRTGDAMSTLLAGTAVPPTPYY